MSEPVCNYDRKIISVDEYEVLQQLGTTELVDRLAQKYLQWQTPYKQVLDSSRAPFYQWFSGGKVDIWQNTIGQHLHTRRRNKAALMWIGVDGRERIYTYHTLAYEVERLAMALINLGAKKGDKVLIFTPNLPETIVTMLACAQIGAIHINYHMAYSSESLAERLQDCQANYIVTADGCPQTSHKLKEKVNDALNKIDHQIKHCIVIERTGERVHMRPKRDLWYQDLITDEKYSRGATVDTVRAANHPLFMLYTSSKTKTAKAVVHNTAGFLMWAQFTTELLFDMDDRDIFWCTADLAWITGHTYGIYGPLSLGSTVFIYEGSISYANTSLFFDFLERFHITRMFSNPALLRSVMRAKKSRREEAKATNSLRLIGCGGGEIKADLYNWVLHALPKQGEIPLVNIWGQTESGGSLMANVPGTVGSKQNTRLRPLPGVKCRLVTKKGETITGHDEPGFLVLTNPLPSLCSDLYGDTKAYQSIYWDKFKRKNYYSTGDEAIRNMDGSYILTGRSDIALSSGAGNRKINEIEAVILSHERVKECAVVFIDHPTYGYMLLAFCVLKSYKDESYKDESLQAIKEHIIEESGEIALPDAIRLTKFLPKTPDNEINRPLLKEISLQMEGL
ncbi:acetyl-CoA synthetase [Desulfuromusa kysingii]|uniref:acetate--CoA ligase n=1 Tax=Desulfuromusa kysingii TaxID=37625 RepID=A0A1H4C4V6_9BACT|nr:AMP-binding protein [Desulfuromusa kysingii]SEA55398.1 acetyl-CoA synthetase [Desulfuromusa kysingii]